MLTIQQTNEFCLALETRIQALRDELADIPRQLSAAMIHADVAAIGALKARQAELNETILNAAAACQRELRQYQSKLSLDQQQQFAKAEKAKAAAEQALTKLRADFVAAEQKMLDDLAAAERRLTELWADARWSNDRVFEFDQALRQQVSDAAALV